MAWWQKGSSIRIRALSVLDLFFSPPLLLMLSSLLIQYPEQYWEPFTDKKHVLLELARALKSTKLVKRVPKASRRSSSPKGMRVELTQLCPNLQCSVASHEWWMNPGWLPWHLKPCLWDMPALTEPSSSVSTSCPQILLQQQMQHLGVFALLFQIIQQKGNCGLLPSFAIRSGQGCCCSFCSPYPIA